MLVFLTATVIVCNADCDPPQCFDDQMNKAKTLYLKNKYEPPLSSDPATEITTSIVATLVEPLRRRNCNGIYEATMIHTTQADGRNGPNGYFGVQGGNSIGRDLIWASFHISQWHLGAFLESKLAQKILLNCYPSVHGLRMANRRTHLFHLGREVGRWAQSDSVNDP